MCSFVVKGNFRPDSFELPDTGSLPHGGNVRLQNYISLFLQRFTMPVRCIQIVISFFILLLLPVVSAQGQSNKVLGEVDLQGAGKVEKDSGVWVDGQYLGYLKELHGDKKVLLLPGEHEITVKQDGYFDCLRRVVIQPGEKLVVPVKMIKDPSFQMPKVFAEIKLAVNPSRAAVFVDGLLVGHVSEFDGLAHSLLVAPGHRKITISLPGYVPFSTEVDLGPNQKFQIKTDLQKAPVTAYPLPSG
jgi:PEGA domain-containing protein